MSREYCPLCRTVTNMSVTTTTRTVAGKDGKLKMVTTRTFHCESCGSFIRSIDGEEDAA